MTRISWGEALRAVLGPALIVGPALGWIGWAALFTPSLVETLSTGMGLEQLDEDLLFRWLGSGLLLGLLLASPVCLLFGTTVLIAASTNRMWCLYRTWCAMGAAAGLLFAMFWSLFNEVGLGLAAMLAAITIPLGTIGAALCRRLLVRKIEAFPIEDN